MGVIEVLANFEWWLSEHTARIDNAWFCTPESLARIHAAGRICVNSFHIRRVGTMFIHVIPCADASTLSQSGLYIGVVDEFPEGSVRCCLR